MKKIRLIAVIVFCLCSFSTLAMNTDDGDRHSSPAIHIYPQSSLEELKNLIIPSTIEDVDYLSVNQQQKKITLLCTGQNPIELEKIFYPSLPWDAPPDQFEQYISAHSFHLKQLNDGAYKIDLHMPLLGGMSGIWKMMQGGVARRALPSALPKPTPARITPPPAPKPVAKPAPVKAKPAPVKAKPAPVKTTPAPKPTPVKVNPAPTPKPAPKPVAKTAPVKANPAPVKTTPAPKPAPVKVNPAPTPKPAPVKAKPAPAPKPIPVKVNPAPTPKPAPVKANPAPVKTTPAPKPAPVKVNPTPTPKPAPKPVAKTAPVKANPAPVKTAPPSVTSSGFGVTRHGVSRKIERQVRSADELDALKKPLKIHSPTVKTNGSPSQRFVGKKAEVVINPKTKKIVSVNPTHSKKANNLIQVKK